MSEWGATDNVRAIEIDAAVADEHLMGWTHWAYKYWNDPTTADDAQGLFRDDADLALGQAGQAAPAGPHLRPGHGRHAAEDAASTPPTGRVRPALPARPPTITAPTRIFVSPLHYPPGTTSRGRHGGRGRPRRPRRGASVQPEPGPVR